MEDQILHEIPVYLSQGLADNLFLFQYPLRPAHTPYDGSNVMGARLKPNRGQVELDIAIETRGPHYSRSKGEQYARGTEGEGSTPYFKSGLMDKQTLTSDTRNHKRDYRYVAGVLKDGELHLTPLKSILQLRPTLVHLDISDNKVSLGTTSDGDTTATESEEEEAKPVTVRFARAGLKNKTSTQKEPEESWQPALYHSIQSAEATQERILLFGGDEDHTHSFSSTHQEYLDSVCPVEVSQQSESPSGPLGVLSLTQLKTLPLEKQVIELMKKAMLLQFDRVYTLLGVGRGLRAAVLDDLQRCAVLVQGCWVVHSSLAVEHKLRNARDYILWCFTKNHIITRKDLTATLKITSSQLRDLLDPLAMLRTGGGWQFRQSLDEDFISKYPGVVTSQNEWWEKRHSDLVLALGIGVSPDTVNPHPQQHGVVTGQKILSTAIQKSKDIQSLHFTPLRQHSLPLNQTHTEGVVKTEMSTVEEAISLFCVQSIGRGVISVSELKDRLLLHQMSLSEGDPLWGQGISDDLVGVALSSTNVVNVGQIDGKKLYALTNIGDKTDPYREIVLNMYKTSRCLKRKVIQDEITKQHNECDNKILSLVLKDLCKSRGSQWFITGMEK